MENGKRKTKKIIYPTAQPGFERSQPDKRKTEPTPNRAQRLLASYAEVRRRKSLRSRIKAENLKKYMPNSTTWIRTVAAGLSRPSREELERRRATKLQALGE